MSHAATLPPEDARRRADAAIGMVIFVGSWSMAFLTLFLSFLIIRHRQPQWPPPGIALPSMGLAALGTGVLLASSLVLASALRRLRTGAPGFAALWAGALLLGLVFAALQAWLWASVWRAGGLPDSNTYIGLFYMLTWFHAAHVACGLGALAWIQLGIARGRIGPARHAAASSVALFWHFVDVVWIVLFLGFFVF